MSRDHHTSTVALNPGSDLAGVQARADRLLKQRDAVAGDAALLREGLDQLTEQLDRAREEHERTKALLRATQAELRGVTHELSRAVERARAAVVHIADRGGRPVCLGPELTLDVRVLFSVAERPASWARRSRQRVERSVRVSRGETRRGGEA